MVSGKDGGLLLLLLQMELLQHGTRLVHILVHARLLLHARRVSLQGVDWSLGRVDHDHCRIHVRRLQVNLRLLQKVEAGLLLLI